MSAQSSPKVFVDLQRLRNPATGLGQFCIHFAENLAKLEKQRPSGMQFELFVPHSWAQKWKGAFSSVFHFREVKPWNKSWMGFKNHAVWHCTHQDSPYLPFSAKTPVVLTIQDLNVLHKYSGVRLAYKLKKIQSKMNRAQVITTTSHYTLTEIQKYLNLKGKQVQVIPLGNPIEGMMPPNHPPSWVSHLVGKPFYFSMGSFLKKKNFEVLIPLLALNPEHCLVIAGNDETPYGEHVAQLAEKLGVSDRLILLGEIDDSSRLWAYANCEAFLFPSLAEGFGLPVVEAMSMGKPVFVSNACSLPEIVGKSGFVWDSFDPNEMNEVLQKGIQFAKNNVLFLNEAKFVASKYSWTKMAQEYLKIYHQLAN